MDTRRASLRGTLRTIAAVVLLLFGMAQVLCFSHCAFGGLTGGSQQSSCSSGHCGRKASPGSGKTDSMPGTTCLTLKNTISKEDAPNKILPNLVFAYFLVPEFYALAPQPEAQIWTADRSAKPLEWIFTPEVYLGPGIHSQAPPLLS